MTSSSPRAADPPSLSPAAEPRSLAHLPVRDELRGRSPYGAPQLSGVVRLNTNENSYSLPGDVVSTIAERVRAELPDLNRYPDRDAVALRQDLAAYLGHGLTAGHLWPANGSNEVQQQLLQAFGGPGRSLLGFTPAYSMHPLLALGTATGWIAGRRSDDFTLTPDEAVAQVVEHDPAVVILCSPNNPTGTALPLDVITAVADAAPGIVVVDEAYAEFARPGTPSALTLLPRYPRLVVSRTMSKAFALAGVRLGYLAADPAVIEAVQLVRLPYHLSALTQAAARAALGCAGTLLRTVEAIKQQRDRIVGELRAMGFAVADSDANFVLFRVPQASPGGSGVADPAPGDQTVAWRRLLDQGVLVRDVGLPGWLRVTAGTPRETDLFLRAVRESLGSPNSVGPLGSPNSVGPVGSPDSVEPVETSGGQR